MGLSTAERNRRKRERKKEERRRAAAATLQEQQQEKAAAAAEQKQQKDDDDNNVQQQADDVEIEYVVPDQPPVAGAGAADAALESVRRFQARAAAVVSDVDEQKFSNEGYDDDDEDSTSNTDGTTAWSKAKLRNLLRPTVAELKRRVKRPDLVEAHDVSANDPDFLLTLKSVDGTVPVPRHWGRKRKYLQGKRGYEKPPFQLPDFLVQTGITELRDTLMEQEADMSAKQKNRMRVTPKLGAMDVDYRSLHDAFFKYQTKPKHLTKFGDMYYEGKEISDRHRQKYGAQPGRPLSDTLRDALGMTTPSTPPPWLWNMQRYGPPPTLSLADTPIPGLNAPLPNTECQYGYHPGGWGKPPIDPMSGRFLYGGNPLDPPGSTPGSGTTADDNDPNTVMVTSHGKTLSKKGWGALPTATLGDEEEEEESSSEEDEMDESSSSSEGEAAEDNDEEATTATGMESTLPPPAGKIPTIADLRKAGTETPLTTTGGGETPKQLYTVLEQTQADKSSSSSQVGTVFASEVAYAVPPPPPAGSAAAAATSGMESVLSKATSKKQESKRKGNDDDDDDDDDDEDHGQLGKNFKF